MRVALPAPLPAAGSQPLHTYSSAPAPHCLCTSLPSALLFRRRVSGPLVRSSCGKTTPSVHCSAETVAMLVWEGGCPSIVEPLPFVSVHCSVRTQFGTLPGGWVAHSRTVLHLLFERVAFPLTSTCVCPFPAATGWLAGWVGGWLGLAGSGWLAGLGWPAGRLAGWRTLRLYCHPAV